MERIHLVLSSLACGNSCASDGTCCDKNAVLTDLIHTIQNKVTSLQVKVFCTRLKHTRNVKRFNEHRFRLISFGPETHWRASLEVTFFLTWRLLETRGEH